VGELDRLGRYHRTEAHRAPGPFSIGGEKALSLSGLSIIQGFRERGGKRFQLVTRAADGVIMARDSYYSLEGTGGGKEGK